MKKHQIVAGWLCSQAQISAMSTLLEKERRREAELELELARLQHANMLDDMLELQVTAFVELSVVIFRDLTRIVKLNSRKFLEVTHYHNFICIEYQHLDNTPN